jgi:hypothetical protein
VYRRAWRQVIYGGLVVLGAWIGTRWGIVGVSWGALAALTVNFFLMASLGQQVAGMTWREFWGAHRPAVLLTIASFPLVWASAIGLRRIEAPAVVTLAACGLVLVLACALMVWRLPRVFLGADGQWMADTLLGFVRRLRKTEGRPKLSGAFESTAAKNPQ